MAVQANFSFKGLHFMIFYANSLFFRFFFVSLPQNHLIVMDYDILQSVSQGSDGAQDAENSRVKAIADELNRRCQLYEAQSGDGQPHVNPFEIEQRITESFAKEHGLWLPIDSVFVYSWAKVLRSNINFSMGRPTDQPASLATYQRTCRKPYSLVWHRRTGTLCPVATSVPF